MDSMMTTKDYTHDFVENADIEPSEIIIGSILLIFAAIMEFSAKLVYLYQDINNIPSMATSISETSLENISQPFEENYIFIDDIRPGWNKRLKLHYLKEGSNNSSEVLLCLHGEPFWSQSYHRIIPFFIREGYTIIVPDLIGFGRSEKYTDWRAYDLELHKNTMLQILQRLNLHNTNKKITLIGHNWGFLLGASFMKDHPSLFHRLVILNTNNLPDGEVEVQRYKNVKIFGKFLITDAFFLAFRASVMLFRNYLPPRLLFHALGNGQYTEEDLNAFEAPFVRRNLDRGGLVSFPLLVPVFRSDKYAKEFSETRFFLANQWNGTRTLIVYSEKTILPWCFGSGDFIVGNRKSFFEHLIPNATISPPVKKAGHIVMFDQAKRVASYVTKFITDS